MPPSNKISEPIAGQLIGDISLPLKRSEKSESVSMFVVAYRSGKALSWKKWTFNPVNKYQHSARAIIPKRNDKKYEMTLSGALLDALGLLTF